MGKAITPALLMAPLGLAFALALDPSRALWEGIGFAPSLRRLASSLAFTGADVVAAVVLAL